MYNSILKLIPKDMNDEEKIDYLEKNRLLLMFFYENNYNLCTDKHKKIKKIYIDNKGKYLLQKLETININEILKLNGIEPINFKGISLASYLYSAPEHRHVGNDIDIYVNSEDYDKAKMILCDFGYISLEKEGPDNPHHIKLKKEFFIIELHKNIFNPFTNINEKYLLQNIVKNEFNILTFDITTTLLHLIYHLYMDTYLVAGSLYSIFTRKTIPKATGFLLRAFEIIMFSRKYFFEINWEQIVEHIKNQKLRIIFKKMVQDIIEIYPETFPSLFLEAVNEINFIDDERDLIYKQILNAKEKNIDQFLCHFIDDTWNSKKHNNIEIHIGESFELKESTDCKNKTNLCCKINTTRNFSEIKIIFTIFDKDIYFSEFDNYNTQGSDGVHLILCSTNGYSYNSIFFFPKKIDDKTKVVSCNVLNNINIPFDESLITASYMGFESGYIITATLTEKFIIENNLKDYFYMGVVVSDCNTKYKKRINEIVLSKTKSEWYNPTDFAKIYI